MADVGRQEEEEEPECDEHEPERNRDPESTGGDCCERFAAVVDPVKTKCDADRNCGQPSHLHHDTYDLAHLVP